MKLNIIYIYIFNKLIKKNFFKKKRIKINNKKNKK